MMLINSDFNILVCVRGRKRNVLRTLSKAQCHRSLNMAKKFDVDASVKYKRKTLEEHACSAQHVFEAEPMSRDSTSQKQIDRREQTKDKLYDDDFLSMYWIAKEELPNCKFDRPI